MKHILSVVYCLLILSSCSKSDNHSTMSCIQGSKTYNSQSGISLEVTQQNWYLEKEGNGGSINLNITGSTNGDSATIRSYGDGLISDLKLELDAQKHFTKDLCISFFATSRPEGDINCGTLIYVYKNAETFEVVLNSCTLHY